MHSIADVLHVHTSRINHYSASLASTGKMAATLLPVEAFATYLPSAYVFFFIINAN